jgi:hypothetical protein
MIDNLDGNATSVRKAFVQCRYSALYHKRECGVSQRVCAYATMMAAKQYQRRRAQCVGMPYCIPITYEIP